MRIPVRHWLMLLLPLTGLTTVAPAQVQVAEGSKNIYVGTIARNAVHEPMLQVDIKNPTGPGAVLTDLTVTAGANASGDHQADLTPAGVELYVDGNDDGRLTQGPNSPDRQIGFGAFNAPKGTVTFSGMNEAVPAGGRLKLLVCFTLNANATPGKSYRAFIAANTDLKLHDKDTTAPLTVTGAPVQGFLRTVGKGTLTLVRVKQTPEGGVAVPNRRVLPLININVLADDVEDVRLDSLDFLDIDTANPVTDLLPDSVRLYNQIAQPATSLQAISFSNFTADGGTVHFTPQTPLIVPRNQSLSLWVTGDMIDVRPDAIGDKFQVQVPTVNPFQATGTMSGDTPALIGTGCNGPEWEFNYNPIVFSLDTDPGAVLLPATAANYPLIVFRAQNDPQAKSEKATLSQLTFHANGTVHDNDVFTSLALYRDTSPYGKLNSTDTRLATGMFNADDGTVTFNFTPITLATAAIEHFVVLATLNGQATDGQTIRLSINTRDDMIAMGEISKANSALIPTPFLGAVKTIGQPRGEFYLETNRYNIPSIVAPEARNFPLLGIRVKNDNDEAMSFKGLHLRFEGPGTEAGYFEGLRLWTDATGNGVQETGEQALGTTVTLAVDKTDAVLDLVLPDGGEVAIDKGKEARFTLYANVARTVKGDGSETFNIVAQNDGDIIALGAGSGAQFAFTTANPPFSEARTVRNPVIAVTNYPKPGQVRGCINGSYGFMGSEFFVPSGEDLMLTGVRFAAGGTLDDAKYVSGAYCWNDKNKDLYVNTSEYSAFGIRYHDKIGMLNDGQGAIDFIDNPGFCKRNENFQLSVGLDFSALKDSEAQAQLGKTATIYQIGNTIITGYGVRSNRPIEVVNASGDDQGNTMTFDWGSLTVTPNKIDRTAAPSNGIDIEVLPLYLKTDILEPVVIDKLVLTPRGTVDESRYIQPGGLKIYLDTNHNGKLDANEPLLATADPPTADNGKITFTGDNFFDGANVVYSFPVGGTPYDQFLLTVDLTPDAPEGQTLQFALETADDLQATGALSLYPYNEYQRVFYPTDGTPPIIGPSIVIGRGAVDLRTTASFITENPGADGKGEVVMATAAPAYEVLRLDVKATAAEDVNLTGLSLRSSGTANELLDLASEGVTLYKGTVAPANLLTSGTFTMDDGAALLFNFSKPILLTSKQVTELRVAFTGNGHGQLGGNFQLALTGLDLFATGACSGLPIRTLGPADPYLAPPIRFGKGKLTVRATDNDIYMLAIPAGNKYRVQPITFYASRTEGIIIEQVTARGAGTVNETTALNNGAMLVNSRTGSNPPVLIGSAPFIPGDNGTAAVRNLNIKVDATKNTSNTYSFDADLKPDASMTSSTLQFNLDDVTGFQAVGALTGLPVDVVLDDFAGGDSKSNVATVTGRKVILSTGLVTITNGDKNPLSATITGSEKNLPLLQCKVAVKAGLEGVTLSEIVLSLLAPAKLPPVLGPISLYLDVDDDGQATSTDVLLGQTTLNPADRKAHFSGLTLTYPENAQANWLFVTDLNGQTLTGDTLKFGLDKGSVTGTGQLTKLPSNLVLPNNATFPGPLYTIKIPPKNAAAEWMVYE